MPHQAPRLGLRRKLHQLGPGDPFQWNTTHLPSYPPHEPENGALRDIQADRASLPATTLPPRVYFIDTSSLAHRCRRGGVHLIMSGGRGSCCSTADGSGTAEIMRRTGMSKASVWRWQERFMAARASKACCATRPAPRASPGSGRRGGTSPAVGADRGPAIRRPSPPTGPPTCHGASWLGISASAVRRIWQRAWAACLSHSLRRHQRFLVFRGGFHINPGWWPDCPDRHAHPHLWPLATGRGWRWTSGSWT